MILLIRPDHNQTDADALANQGIETVIAPLLQISPLPSDAAVQLADQLTNADDNTWLLVTSGRTWPLWAELVNGLAEKLRAGLAGGLRIASVGNATSDSLPEFSRQAIHTSTGISAEDLLAHLRSVPRGVALLPGSARSRPVLADGLREAGWTVNQVGIYQTEQVNEKPELPAHITGVVVRSPSAAQALNNLVEVDFPVYAVGPISTAKARSYGWQVIEIFHTDPAIVAQEVRNHIENR